MPAVTNPRAIIRGLLGALLLLIVFCLVDTKELVSTLTNISLSYVAYLFLIALLMIWISCVKWRMFLRSQGADADIFFLMRLYTIGYFVNTFTPSFIGGDIVRSLHLGDRVTNKRDAYIATFLERFTGLLAMASLGVLFVAFGANATAGVETAILLVGFGALSLALVVFCPPAMTITLRMLRQLLRMVPQIALRANVEKFTEKMIDAAQAAQARPLLLVKAMGLSFIFHILTVINTQAAALAVGWHDVNLAGLFVVVPLVLLVGMAPVTPSGIGIQEGAFLFFLQRIGGSKAESLGVGIVLRAKVIVIALLGWGLWVTLQRKKNTGERHNVS